MPIMKYLLRNTLFHAVALYLLPQMLNGVKISGGWPSYLIGGLVYALLTLLVRPVIHIFTLPLNLLTFGLFTFLIDALFLYLLTVFVPQVTVGAFVFPGIRYLGFVIPPLAFNTFFAYIVSSVVMLSIVSFLRWLSR